MERVRRLSQFWNWLPAFRVVAETEHLPTAAKELGIGAPGLSRMIKLVESSLGEPLFERRAGRLVLNEAGQLFLHHVRDAMRRVDDGLAAIAGQAFSGGLKIAASNSASLVLALPALELLAARHPRLVPELESLDESQACARLLEGHLDLALIEQYEADTELDIEQLSRMSYGIYCGTTHRLAEQPALALEDCLPYPFVATAGGAQDGWPVNLRREVALRVNSLNLAVAACATGRLLALLPDAVASRYPHELRRVAVGTIIEQPIYIAHRPLLSETDRVAALIEALHSVALALRR